MALALILLALRTTKSIGEKVYQRDHNLKNSLSSYHTPLKKSQGEGKYHALEVADKESLNLSQHRISYMIQEWSKENTMEELRIPIKLYLPYSYLEKNTSSDSRIL